MKSWGVELLLVHSDVLGNEASENRKRYNDNYIIIKIQSVPLEIMENTAKAIADRIDFGDIILPINQKDYDSLKPILEQNVFGYPNLKISVYKNRRGRYKSMYLWCQADLGTCRVKPMFATTWSYELIDIDNTKIMVEENKNKGAF